MKCFNHIDLDATATCQECGKGLCINCSSRFNVILCEGCLLNHNKSVSREMYIGLAITISIFIGFTYLLGTMTLHHGKTVGFEKAWIFGLLLSFTFWGWRFLNNYLPTLASGTGAVWIIYLFIKFTAAYFIGILVGPYQIFKMSKEIYRVQKVRGQITRGEI